ncbi:single-stranded DNA-binding protein [Candidatus Nephthysia bennettiae]|uniref:Single-stranded DNA-binding protein n=1 Tax=Candidatus Nephthysia bennettiae TaxID=3127016 RepID=A0A934KDB0_9BACT|nr:single-stranded DNA-binding protein [Candidatus Dormibacteraeota bacterium]MBJ7607714.1 single-stranded DNA-binding protein [Candidatus Dormibacteraeota bacterium]MBJ7612605.1 single-stranded DNA-binding protein [Candidatus Dormibacteraeota bacterium]
MAGFADINHWQLTGRMARDAEVQESNGRKRLRLRVAVHESGPEGTAHFLTVVAFGHGEAMAATFKSGQAVRLGGRVSAWRDQAGKERLGLVAEELTALP